ncbi:MAG: 30S ribosomal protein S27e [Nitrososphaeria archaeon]
MVKKEKILVPKPRSAFCEIECSNCKTRRIIFSASTTTIKCPSCNALLCESRGGKAKIYGNILKRLDSV